VTQGWENWGKEEDDVTRQIREYRTSLSIARQQHMQTSEEEEVKEDFFQVSIVKKKLNKNYYLVR
jgi:hypothetical protein